MTDQRYPPVPPPRPGMSPVPQSPPTPPPGSPPAPPGQWWPTPHELPTTLGSTTLGPTTLGPTTLGPAAGSGRRRGAPRWVIALAVATAVLSVVSFTTVLLWPGGDGGQLPRTGPLAFHAFEQVARIDFDQPSRTTFTRVLDDRLYVAWEQGGDLEVVAADVATGAERWRRRVTGSPQWGELFPVPGAVVVVGTNASGAAKMHVLDAGGGAELAQREVSPDDWVSAIAGSLVWYHEPSGVLSGLEIATGTEVWSQPVAQSAVTTWMLTEEDLVLPTDTAGYLGVTSTDPRLVVVDDDRSVTVIDASTGTVVGQAGNIGRPRDYLLGYAGRLFVAGDEAGFQVVSYDLDDLSGLPQTHYRADTGQYPEALEACGSGRICLLETESFSRETTEAVLIDVADGAGELWRRPVPDARTTVSVGPWVLVTGHSGPVIGFDAAGQEVLNRPGVAARLNAENLLVFADPLGSYDQDVTAAGIAIEGDRPVELGQLADVVGDQCSWNVLYLTCPDRDGATIYRFAEP